MPAPSLRPLRFIAPALALVLLAACSPRSSETAPDQGSGKAGTGASAAAKPARLIGPAFTLVDKLERPLECVILAKEGALVLVKRSSDQATYLIDFDRLSPATQQMLSGYPDENVLELRTFAHDRDYAEAKRTVRVEMISATWCGYCTQAKNFFASEGITYSTYDHESMSGKERKRTWKTDALPAVKIGDQVIEGFNKDAYIEALLGAYRQQLAAAPQP